MQRKGMCKLNKKQDLKIVGIFTYRAKRYFLVASKWYLQEGTVKIIKTIVNF